MIMLYKNKVMSVDGSTYQSELVPSSMNASWYAHMLLCLIEAKMRTSFRAFSFSLSESLPILTFFSAYY